MDNLRCVFRTDLVAFQWNIPEWSGGEVASYDYRLTLPDGSELSRGLDRSATRATLVLGPDSFQPGDAAHFRITANYETSDGSTVASAEATLTCRLEGARTLAITPNSSTRQYGGTDDLSYTVSGLVDGDDAEDVVSGSLARASGDDAGRYAIDMGTLAIAEAYATKYRLPASPAVATYVITPKPATYTGTAPGKVYDGTTTVSGPLSGSFAAGDIINGDAVTASGGTYASADAGISIAISGVSAGGADAGNYSVTFSVSGAITPREITAISGVTVNAREADGTTTATFDKSSAEGTGVLSTQLADFRAGGLLVSGAFPAATAGFHDLSVTYSLQDHGGFKAGNYTLATSAATDSLRGELQTASTTPTVTSALTDVTGLEVDGTQEVSLSGVFSDADGDSLTITAASSDETKATVTVASDYSKLTLAGVSEGTATITVTARDSDGNTVSDTFDAPVAKKYTALIAQMYEWRNDPKWSSFKEHTDRWDRALLAFGETVADQTLEPMTAAEAQGYADQGSAWSRWVEVAIALREIEAAGPPGTPNQAPTVSSAIANATIVNESGTQQVSLTGVFSDADNDALTITAVSSDDTKATVSVASDGSSLTVTAKSRGTATITVTADDGNGGTVDDSFTVTVKAAPVVASAISDASGMEVGATQEVSLAGVFSDADGDALTITTASSDETKATVTVASDYSKLTLAGVSEGTATITVTARDSDGNTVSDSFDAPVVKAPQPNRAPTVSSAIADATIVNESGTHQASLSGVFTDADNDSLTITADSSDDAKATVSVASDGSSLTVTAKSKGTATITVTANDGNGGSVDDTFTVTVKAAPVVASVIADISGLEEGATQDVSLSGVFSDADGDTLTITASSSDETKATVSVASDGSRLTLTGVAEGTATITVTAEDSDGNTVSNTFDVEVVKRFASLIPQMYQYRNDPCCAHNKEHTDRWDRTLLAFGETVADTTLTKMTADEAQGYADQGWTRWVEVAKALEEMEGDQQPSPVTCLPSGVQPVPVAVSEIPIVVSSTADDYFVLYVLQELNGETLELPVSVTRGKAGTTTLTDNLEALPANRYKVKKYQVTSPADVDGDCIDDIAELQDLGTKNPLNPAKAINIRNGAVAIPDRETFETLSYQGDLPYPRYESDVEYVKFVIFRTNNDRPAVYFMNTETHRFHLDFINALGPNAYRGIPRVTGEIVYHRNAVGPDGSLSSPGIYRYQFVSLSSSSFEMVAYLNEVLAANMPFLENNLAYFPNPADAALYDASRVDVLLREDIFPDVDFIPLNRGEGYGFLREMNPDDRPNPRDVVIYETLPNDLPRVAGIITTVPQTPLSHVNLRAVQDDVPNAFIRDALDDSGIDDLIGSHVHYTVTQSGYTLRAAAKAEVDAHYESSRPAEAQTPERDLSVTAITALSDVDFDDWDAFGVKAANVAVLGTLGFPSGTVPDGFAVPFYFYDEFMKNAALAEETLFGKKKWDEADKFTLAAGTKLSAAVTTMLAHPKFQTDYEVQDEMLDDLRDAIKDAESPQWIIDALTAMHATYPEGQSLRYRSSTNNEDLPGFSGAGLYSSKTQDPDETAEDGIDKSIKAVWASLWNFRAFVERDFHRIDHTKTAMGVLVHPNYSDELANGVAVSFDPFSEREGAYYVNTQVGEDLVTNPEAHSAPEEILLLPDGSYEVLVYSNQGEQRELLMSDAQMSQLRRHLKVIYERFAALYNPAPGDLFAMEIEFKITRDNVLSIKQARPWVFQRDSPTARVKVAPVVASAISDVTGLEVGATEDVSLYWVFSDADGDTLTITAASSDKTKATVSVEDDGSRLTVSGVAEGMATITVMARDTDGNTVSDTFDVSVVIDIVTRYDANGDGRIDYSEWMQAKQDFSDKKITYSEMIEVYLAYRASSGS